VPDRSVGCVAAFVCFVLACGLPSVFFLLAAFSEDSTASESGGSAAVWLIAIEVAVGGMISAVAWGVGRTRSVTARRVAIGFVLAGATVWGLVTGFLGGVVIAMERHPTWDDA
jgi:hypothetical protein